MEKLVIMSLTLGLSWCGTDLCKRVKIREVRPYGHTMCKNLCDCFKSPSIYDFTRLTCRCNDVQDNTEVEYRNSSKSNKSTNRENAVGQECLTNTSCSSVNTDTFCYKGMCRCNVGLSLHANGKCVRHCKTYGTTFTTYDFYSTTGHNNKRVPSINMTECKQRCLTETEFMCISAEFVTVDFSFTKSVSCYLSNDSFLDALDSERQYSQPRNERWYFLTRNCKGAKHIG